MRTRLILTVVVSVLALLLLATAAYADSAGTHVVRAGETLADIAAQHRVSVSALIRANGIANPDLIRIGQVLVIPGTSGSGSSGSGPAKTGGGTYTVRQGDTLGVIAQRLGVSASALASLNGIKTPIASIRGWC